MWFDGCHYRRAIESLVSELGGKRQCAGTPSARAAKLTTSPDVWTLLLRRWPERADYRHVSAFVHAAATTFSPGDIMCVAFAGTTARPPQGRNSRWPGSFMGRTRRQIGGTEDGCKEFLATQALDELLKQPWTREGLLKNFSLAREDGVPQPDPANVAQTVKRLKASARVAAAPVVSRTVQRNAVTCTNHCVNGDCVRTFPDGRKERWQAPRVYDPVTRNWKLDTATNACGV